MITLLPPVPCKLIEGDADHVPLNLHQNILADMLAVPVSEGKAFHTCPPVALTANVVMLDALLIPIMNTISPSRIEPGGVTVTVAVFNVPLSAGLDALFT